MILSYVSFNIIYLILGDIFLPKVCPIGETSNSAPSHHHDDYNVASDRVSSIPASNIVLVGGVASANVDVTTLVGGVVAIEARRGASS